MAKDKPKLTLSEMDGNAFSILARARKAARRAGWTDEQVSKFTTEASSSDYDHLLQTCMKYFDCE